MFLPERGLTDFFGDLVCLCVCMCVCVFGVGTLGPWIHP